MSAHPSSCREARTGHMKKEHLSQEDGPSLLSRDRSVTSQPLRRLLPGLCGKLATAPCPCKPVWETPQALQRPCAFKIRPAVRSRLCFARESGGPVGPLGHLLACRVPPGPLWEELPSAGE